MRTYATDLTLGYRLGEGGVGADLRFADVYADSKPRCSDQKWVVSCEA
jgi:hypothetical protein